MSKEMEQFLEELENIVDSGGGKIEVDGTMQRLNTEEAEAALLVLSMSETKDIKKAMTDWRYFWEVVERGMEEMGYEHNTKQESNEGPNTYIRVLDRMKKLVQK